MTYQQALYLNNDGSRWVVSDSQVMVLADNGYRKIRRVDFWEAFGNFAAAHIRMHGKRVSALPDSFPDDETDLPILDFRTTPERCPSCGGDLMVHPSWSYAPVKVTRAYLDHGSLVSCANCAYSRTWE